MLAARSAWAILGGEHAQLRSVVEGLARALHEGGWHRPGPAQSRMRQLLVSLQDLDVASHRPKGVALTEAMSGRSVEADRLLAKLRSERERDDALFASALALLDELCHGNERVGAEFSAALTRFCDGVLRQLDEEDTLLRMHAERLLTDEEWSRVVSSISSALYPAASTGSDAGPV